MASIDEILNRLGGAEPAAKLTGVGLEAIRKWRQARAIPSKHWSAIVAATGLAFADLQPAAPSTAMTQSDTAPPGATAALVLADGAVFWGVGFGAHSDGRVGETVLQHGDERLPGNADRRVLRRADHHLHLPPHRQCRHQPGDMEAINPAALGLVVKQDVTEPSNWRSTQPSTPGCGRRACRASAAWTPAP